MPNTYTQIHIQAVFAVKYRQSLISSSFEDDLYKYITGILQSEGHKMLQINGMPDHVHLLFGFRPTQSLSDLIKIIKSKSSKWINKNGLSRHPFAWQNGYGAFSYSLSSVPNVARYIQRQKEHHRQYSFHKEFEGLLSEHGVTFDDQYLFKKVINL